MHTKIGEQSHKLFQWVSRCFVGLDCHGARRVQLGVAHLGIAALLSVAGFVVVRAVVLVATIVVLGAAAFI